LYTHVWTEPYSFEFIDRECDDDTALPICTIMDQAKLEKLKAAAAANRIGEYYAVLRAQVLKSRAVCATFFL